MTIDLHGELPDLSGIHAAIRLKWDLLRRLAAHPPSRWRKHVLRFIVAVERSPLTDRTALVVLLTELREQVRLLLGIGTFSAEPEEAARMALRLEAWAGLPRTEILARFKEEIVALLSAARSSHARLSPIVHRTKCLVDERYADPLTLGHLAASVGRSKRHLGNLFRQELEMTVHEYLTQVRLHRALELIRNGEKIEAVSLLVGYRSKKNFYRHFKTHVGVTPLEYRAALLRIQPSS
jgi:AraC-like DNA-binding protein